MRLAIIYWKLIHSVGGIATHLNRIRDAALRYGDTCDILLSDARKSKRSGLFPEGRRWVRGGDTNIWVCGLAPNHPNRVEETIAFLEKNYDGLYFSMIAPPKITSYPEPHFLAIYERCRLPKVARVSDGYWDMHKEWGELCLPYLDAVLCPLESYASVLPKEKIRELVISPFPFAPQLGKVEPKSPTPLLVWPNQWKDVKGIKPFLEQVPRLPKEVAVELYSCGIRYYQLRTEDCWKNAVGKDLFKGYDGKGRAIYYGNVDSPTVLSALQRAHFTCNLQGMRTRKDAYRRGSYNNTEVEALWYGACPILHRSTQQTDLPKNTYEVVDCAEEILDVVAHAIRSGFPLSPDRIAEAREFVRRKHLASARYLDLRNLYPIAD